MQLYRLDDGYFPEESIDGYKSLIWTERYTPAGDFSLVTANIQKTMDKLPLGSCVALHDSKEVCFVETHEIERDDDGNPQLTVSGRSFETFLENRSTLINEVPIKSAIDDTNAVMINDQAAPYAAMKIIDNARGSLLDTHNVIPNIDGTITAEALRDEGEKDRFITRGRTYDEVLRILQEENNGIRNIRPTGTGTKLLLNIYQNWSGVTTNPNVVLDVTAGHFIGGVKYTWSIKEYKTAVYVASKNYFVKVYATGASGYSGLDHRVDLVDYPDITQTGTKIPAMLRAKGKTYLNKHKKQIFVEGSVSPEIPYKYNVDYGLGDNIRVRGEFGANDIMQVAEYIRSEDENGEETAYPTLV